MIITTNDFQALDFNSVDIDKLYFNNDLVWQKLFETTGVPPLTFTADGNNLVDWSIDGNMSQTGVPTPTNMIEVQSCGDLVTTGEHAGEYVIPITCGGTTTNIYINEPLRKLGNYVDRINFKTGTITRQIKEVVLTGNEDNWIRYATTYYRAFPGIPTTGTVGIAASNAFGYRYTSLPDLNEFSKGANENLVFNYDNSGTDLAGFKTWLSQQYTNGTPVIVYHALATPTTELITLPTIPTSAGANTLTVGTTLQPSSMTVKYHK